VSNFSRETSRNGSRNRWKDNMMYVLKTGCENMSRILLSRNTFQCQAYVLTVMHLKFSQKQKQISTVQRRLCARKLVIFCGFRIFKMLTGLFRQWQKLSLCSSFAKVKAENSQSRILYKYKIIISSSMYALPNVIMVVKSRRKRWAGM
jgi:hypothetical protein